MKISVYAVGDKMEKFYLEAIKEYEKRLSRYCNIKLAHLKKASDLQKKLNTSTFVIAITTSGKSTSSEELAVKLNQNALSSVSDISIVIGAYPPEYNETLTLSQMEMDFGLQTTVLFEQIYRAYRIINNHPYHK
ncbi:23S rRNA (pseudouridine(1915)-N(3))-methyltransferase RlmH [Paenibacillus sp. AK121]|uniref:23S rRNA (pseudouridine(1915)-N(3))-methyltransferase RlmH n=1 Tax=Paenibacillus TaxID=44249 RepID=UPI001C24F7C9|nr:23S rRNA (pseudouridine(1915)-N(3))-methyltransferase RlmH [Paenibacillus sp. AK121]MBU9706004.1 23S rRNA (pseudouridine(1915)-N(3))-methyltransferase RlmH [Paenibacillus sp. AK121]MEE4568135.1 23S rRNA (pseudouridine(1915)-N(3))-methyltransferase RlmH [Paenibacillus polymyxa]